MNDYSEYLKKPGMMEWIESEWLSKPHHHDSYAKAVNDTIKKFKLKTVLEIGCGTGEVAKRIDSVIYTGLDINEECVRIAESKVRTPNGLMKLTMNGSKFIRQADIRKIGDLHHDLVCTFGVLKHFGLHEWKEIFAKVCSLGDYLIFNMPIGETKDDGEEYHHVWMDKVELLEVILENGFALKEMREENPVEPIFICKRIEN